MQVSVESLGNHERRLTFRLPAERIDTQVGGRLREIARTARIKGFRPGKVPAKVIQQRYGQQVRAEVLDGVLRESFDSAVRDNELRLAGNPKIEPSDQADENELAYIATFEVVPDFGEIDVAALQVVRNTADIDDEDIDRMIENLRQQRTRWVSVERGAKDGDQVELGTWSQCDGERLPAEGMENGRSTLGSGQLLAAIETALIGMKAGEEKAVDVEFPADWRVTQLAGKTAQVHLQVSKVNEQLVPALDADFIRSFGVKSGEIEDFRSEIRSNLQRELKGALMGRLRREVGEQLIAAFAHVELPPKMVDNEARAMAQQAQEQARQQGRQLDAAAQSEQAYVEAARKRTLVGLLVGEVARRNELKLDPARLQETMRLIASTYEEPEQVIELYRNDARLMSGLQNRVMEEQVIDWIAERAQHTEKSLSFQEAIAA